MERAKIVRCKMGITGRFFDPLKMAESITDLRTHGYKDSRK